MGGAGGSMGRGVDMGTVMVVVGSQAPSFDETRNPS